MKNKQQKQNKKLKGFSFYRTEEQLKDYMAIPAEKKLQWLEEMWRFNRLVAEDNPEIGKIQEMFRQGEI